MRRLTLARPDGELVGGETGDGPVALLLHAGRERRGVWDPIAASLAGGGFRAIAWDQRGHGDTTAPEADTLPPYAEDLAAMVDALEGAMPLLVGASLGGLAELLALADPELQAKVAGLVLVDVVPDPDPEAVRAYLAATFGESSPRPMVDDVLARAAQLRSAASALGVPTLLVRGGARSPLPDADVERFRGLVGHARVRRIDGAGHLVAREAPDPLAEVLLAELARPEVRARRIAAVVALIEDDAPGHPTGTLAPHLARTAARLTAWGAPDWLIDAGQLHAAYGTEGFASDRMAVTPGAVRRSVGARAERLIDLYSRCDRRPTYATFLTSAPAVVDRTTFEPEPLDTTELRALAELTVANELDVLERDPDIAAEHGAALIALFSSWRPLLSDGAREAVARFAG
jgi:pimeloyl-ACP methyl ester carboxylesterase